MNLNTTRLISIVGAIALSAIGFTNAWAADDAKEQAELATALKTTTVTLQSGLRASASHGKPISAKFEVEDGKLQLSIYTMKDNGFSEVVVDPKTGKVAKSEAITDKGDLDHAAAQKTAMDQTKMTLLAATDKAHKANAGYRVVSAMPDMKDGKPVVEIALSRGTSFKTVTEKLN
jgi:uncharacterized membrane protein YkoI